MENTLTVYKDGVVSKIKNKRIMIVKSKSKQHLNKVILRSLTSDSGFNAGVSSTLSENGKIKESVIGLTDDALLTLYHTISEYFKEIKYPEQVENLKH